MIVVSLGEARHNATSHYEERLLLACEHARPDSRIEDREAVLRAALRGLLHATESMTVRTPMEALRIRQAQRALEDTQ